MRTRVRAALAAALTASLLSLGSVAADPGTKLLEADLVGIPAGAAALFAGVTGGGLPWVLDKGEAKLLPDGRIQVEVEGLVLAAGAAIGMNPFPTGRAIVSCSNGADVVMSDPVPYSPEGDAKVDAQLALPSPCLGPIVFFAGQTGAGPRWFAVSGG